MPGSNLPGSIWRRGGAAWLLALALAAGCERGCVTPPDIGDSRCDFDRECGTASICDTRIGRCVAGCRDDEGCAGGRCEGGQCVRECYADRDCASGFVCRGSECVSAYDCNGRPGGCAGCTLDEDCAGGRRCQPATGKCLDCVADHHCWSGYVCDTWSGTCVVGCSVDKICPAGSICDLPSGTCVECLDDSHCSDVRPYCDDATRTCQECLVDDAGETCGRQMYCANDPAINANGCRPGCEVDDDCVAVGVDAGASLDGGLDGGGALDGGLALSGREHCDKVRHECVRCTADLDCPLGRICRGNQCVPGCSDLQACDGALTCCDGTCVDATSDLQNCGGCGVNDPRFVCQGGWSCCGGACSNPASDPDHCGRCGEACPMGTTCVARTCQ